MQVFLAQMRFFIADCEKLMDNTDIILERLNVARKKLKLKHKDLADILGLSPSSVSSAFSRKSMKISKIKLLANELHINTTWLFEGKGDMFVSFQNNIRENDLEYNLKLSRVELINLVINQQKLIESKDELLAAKDKMIAQLNELILTYKK